MSDVPLLAHIEQAIRAERILTDEKVASLYREIEKASTVLNHRLEGMNEFRNQIMEERLIYVRKDQLDAATEILRMTSKDRDDRLRKIEDYCANLTGRIWMLGVTITAASGIVMFFITRMVK